MRKCNNDIPIDFVMTWLDDTDPVWRASYRQYKDVKEMSSTSADGVSQERFRNWDNLKYWFRGVEKFAPWVNNIYLVTCGQCPEWLDTSNPKIHLVDHKDYIPEKYLPVFSSHPIELNLHRINGLSENFVYFNDDIFILKQLAKTDFFINGEPREMAVEFPLYSRGKDSFEHILLNMSGVLNTFFRKKQVIKENRVKWFHPVYGKYLINNICMQRYSVFSGIITPHFPSSLNKKRINEIWEKLFPQLDETCSHRFRSAEDINQYIFRFWNIMTGKFYPTNFDKYARFVAISDDNVSKVEKVIKEGRVKLLCINDSKNVKDFELVKSRINSSLNELLPQKSSFEL